MYNRANLAFVDVMITRSEEFVDGFRVGENHEGEAPREPGVLIHLDRYALDLAVLSKVLTQLFVGGITRQSADEEFPLIVLAGYSSGGLPLGGLLVLLLLLLLSVHVLALGLLIRIIVDRRHRRSYFARPLAVEQQRAHTHSLSARHSGSLRPPPTPPRVALSSLVRKATPTATTDKI